MAGREGMVVMEAVPWVGVVGPVVVHIAKIRCTDCTRQLWLGKCCRKCTQNTFPLSGSTRNRAGVQKTQH